MSAASGESQPLMLEDMIENPAIESGDLVRMPLAPQASALSSSARRGRKSLAHSIGARVSDTAAEMRMATARVTANSRNSRPDHIAHEEERDQHRDQGQGQRDDGKAYLL